MTLTLYLSRCDTETALEFARKRLAYLHAADLNKSETQGLYTEKLMKLVIEDAERDVARLERELG